MIGWVSGKTIEAISVLMYLIENGYTKKSIIFCKKSLRRQWVNELGKFTNYDPTKVLMIDGTKKKKEEIYNSFISMKEGILVTNFDVMRLKDDFKLISKNKVDCMILDEAHIVSGYTTQINKAISKFNNNVKYKIFLTGTPMANKPDDLFGVMQMLDKKFFGTKKQFDEEYLYYEVGAYGKELVGYKNLFVLEEITHDIIISRSEIEVELDLPEVLPPNTMNIEMDNTQQKIYNYILNEKKKLAAQEQSCRKKINELKSKGASLEAIKAQEEKIETISGISMGLSADLQYTANDPRILLFTDNEKKLNQYSELIPNKYAHSPKTETLFGIIENIVDSNEKAIVFSIHKRTVNLLKKDIEEKLNIKCSIYTGGMNTKERDESVDAFVNDDEVKVFLATSAANEGLNLEVSNHIIHYDQPPRISDKQQREGRARRVGSKYKKVYVYNLITENSIDEDKLENLNNRSALTSNVAGNSKARSKAIIDAMK